MPNDISVIDKRYKGTFDKTTAIKAMKEGYAVVPKNRFDDTYFIFNNNRFVIVDGIELININFEELGVDEYILYSFIQQLMPKILWKSNIKDATIKKIEFKRIYSQGHIITENNMIWCICEYIDEDNMSYGVKFEKNYNKPKITMIYLNKTNFLIKTKGIHPTLKSATYRLKCWVDSQVEIKQSLKNTPLNNHAKSIIKKYPEIFI